MTQRPRLLVTLGDVAGIGPEIVARAWPELIGLCRPVVVGDPPWLARAFELVRSNARVQQVYQPDEAEATAEVVPCLKGSSVRLRNLAPGRVHAAAGQAAYDFLSAAIDLTLHGRAEGIVTCPLHKEGLRAAGLPYPGHTEILAERTGARRFGMVLYAHGPALPHGLAVVHVTLHVGLREVVSRLSRAAIREKIELLDALLPRLNGRKPRLGVAALNPHASDGGLFGDEENRLIQPAIERARKKGILVTGPWPGDTLFVRARDGEFDGIVAMYHDQGHIALKLLAGRQAVNITVGLPLVRTSVAHGTAYDIAWQGCADPASLTEATRVAARLVVNPPSAAPVEVPTLA
jgi:4-hydroxythreonine-4-phosphate dehydrogenase